jgi:hypothetical protein
MMVVLTTGGDIGIHYCPRRWLHRRRFVTVFFGIIIRMYYDDHAPSHFHAYYGEYSAQISIQSLDVIGGSLPKRVLALAV